MARGQHTGNKIRFLLGFGEVFELAAFTSLQFYESSAASARAEGFVERPSSLQPNCFALT